MRLHSCFSRCFFLAAGAATLLLSSASLAAGNSVLSGKVIDVSTREPIAKAVVIVTSPALQGERTAVTDDLGAYRLDQLPAGEYTVQFDGSAYKPSSRSRLTLRQNSTVRLHIQLMPESLTGEIEVNIKPPTIDVGSSTIGLVVDSETAHRLAIAPSGGRIGAVRSFDSLARLAPGTVGTSMQGSTPTENRFQIDGISVGSATQGYNDNPLSLEFVKEVHVITGGYMPEFGRSTGGAFDVTTKSGGNEFHGSVFGTFTPGAFEAERTPVRFNGSSSTFDGRLAANRDFGFEVGGPILKNRLWFYAGANITLQETDLERSLHRLRYETNPDGTLKQDANGRPIRVRDEFGFQLTDPIAGTPRRYVVSRETVQYIGKLTWMIRPEHTLTLSVFGSPWWSGGDGRMSYGWFTGGATQVNTGNLLGNFDAFARQESSVVNTVSLKLASAFLNRKLLLDASLGYHHVSIDVLPVDGSEIGSGQGLANVPGVSWARTTPSPRTIADFEKLPANSGCEPAGSTTVIYCPITSYATGGPGDINEQVQNRWQARAVLTYIASARGQHVVKAGIDVEMSTSLAARANSGGVRFQEAPDGTSFQAWRIGSLTSPDDLYVPMKQSATTYSAIFGGFIQDSYTIFDRITLNAGLRYDAQVITTSNGIGMTLPNQWSPRVGAVYDFSGQGRSKLFVSYARYYENVPLQMAHLLFAQNSTVVANVSATVCDPTDPEKLPACLDPQNGQTTGATSAPSRQWSYMHSQRAIVDPEIEAQSMDEIVAGLEYQVFDDARVGLNYTHRGIVRVIEDMSRDEGTSFLIGNPGFGGAADFPRARRDYDALTLYFQKSFSSKWLALASYTLSYLRGNYPGLANSPNYSAEFDLISLLPNRDGPLPGDRRHSLKVFAVREFSFFDRVVLNLGVGYTGLSGPPLNVFGAHTLYGVGSAYILPRGAGGTLPWVHNVDTNLSVGYKFNSNTTLAMTLDVFNLFNFQTVTGRDQTFTSAAVRPIEGGTVADLPKQDEAICASASNCRYKLLNHTSGLPLDPARINPNYGNITGYQGTRQIRFGARLTF